MTKGIDVDQDDNDCSRGLEFKVPHLNKIRSERRRDILTIVMLEQEIQEKEGIWDDDSLADAYIRCNEKIIQEALERGGKDEIAARDQ